MDSNERSPTGKGVTENLPDSIGTVDHLASAKQVMSLQKAIQGKKIVFTGGTSSFTAEAWEFNRKRRLHQQLKLARRLRCIMEGALDEGKKANGTKDTKRIFFERSDDMLELASLTNAVLGGFTMDSYHEYKDIQIYHEEKRQESFESSHKYLNDLRQRMLWEDSPETFFRDNRAAILRRQQTTVSASDKANVSSVLGAKGEKKKPTKIPKHTKLCNNNAEKKIDVKTPDEFHSHKVAKKKAFPTSKNFRATKTTLQRNSSSDSKRHNDKEVDKQVKMHMTKAVKQATQNNVQEMTTFIARHNLANPIIVAPSKRSTTSNSNVEKPPMEEQRKAISQAINKVPKRAKLKTKKCHHCKELKSQFSTCGYWFANGNRCKKVFCHDCALIYNMEPSDTDDWHCPSCLGKCTCAVCIKARERELLRATKRRRLRS